MPGERFELSLLTESDLKSDAATNYATRAIRPGRELHSRIEVLQTSALLLGYQATCDELLPYYLPARP